MQARHEYKHAINYADYLLLRSRLRTTLPHDENAGKSGEYFVRSLYFDTPNDKALREKIDGVNNREKFRIRFYNCDPSFIRLEKKSKRNGLCYKESAMLTQEEAQSIIDGENEWMIDSQDPLLLELYAKMRVQLLRPRTIVDYLREPFAYAPGNVRLTIDRNIRTGIYSKALFDEDLPAVSAEGGVILLEVKYDNFLPEMIRQLVQMDSRRAAAFSKYAACRLYG